MRLDELQPCPGSKHKKKRVGRGTGSGHGKTACRGHKGQRSRSGAKLGPAFEGGQMPIIRRLPKRGFTNIFRKPQVIINLRDLTRFPAGTVVDEEVLKNAGLVPKSASSIKLLADGAVTVPLTVRLHAVSGKAREMIEAQGGAVEVI
ncbi:50S ribosomal protein L15 [Desulfobacca acetoxidans]|uniref:Large ribosomal subunit protein uL15 n=1 Tax=Desulfobacca acetoxidans (strain ATCC 700848 / DSM 11109 / ASRB2) TaxID=880072 RepID=F2NJC0_DESAR|nr:50S ribosomal protein L15 [Desulfobacca acetoxidans]AEB09292.1 ribosomal protein L15 [Desulfobacca acetoxidans DSM 11109]HAY22503.1 50S ribosomal protein L15 [Desulfobacterales bacterium]